MSLPGGSMIVAKPVVVSVFGYNAGTLGAWVKYNLSGEPAFLTNGHVLPKVAVDVYHRNVQGELIGAVLDTGFNDRIDAAIGKCSMEKGFLHSTKSLGPMEDGIVYRGFEAPQQNEVVVMYGAVSGLGIGDVNLLQTHTKFGSPSFEVKMWDDYRNWGVHGDSGSVLLNSSENIVGIFWGHSGNKKYAQSIIDVQRILGISPL